MDKKIKQSTDKIQSLNSIGIRQNTDRAILLLKAQRKLYEKAKNWKKTKLVLALVSFVGAVVILPIKPEYKIYLALFGGLVSALNALWLKSKVKNLVQKAARIQEEFDVFVLDLPDNKSLTGTPVTKEVIHQYGDKESDKGLLDWYPDLTETDSSKAVLIAQRSNLVWDWRQREIYTNWLTIISLVVLVGGMLVGVIQDFSVRDYLLMILLPTMPFLLLGINNVRTHQEVIIRQKAKEIEIDKLVNSRQDIPKETLRSIQDAIYKNRKSVAIVPKSVYKIIRSKFQKQMEAAAKSFQQTK